MIWKDIKGFEGEAQISDTGLYKRFSYTKKCGNRDCTYKERITAGAVNKDGYKMIRLPDGTRKYVHRVVAETFIPNSNNYPIINHKDENPSNNRVENLEWCDKSYNAIWGTSTERGIAKRIKSVSKYDGNGNHIQSYPSIAEAARQNNTSKGNIFSALDKPNRKAANFIWKSK